MTRDFWCKVCGGYLSTVVEHHCPPRFECRIDEKDKTDMDWSEVYANSAETAAEQFAERHDCCNEYWILQQGDRCEAVIEARDQCGAITRWSIRAESVPHYFADEITDDPISSDAASSSATKI